MENPHGVKGEAVQDLNTAIMKGQSKTLDAEHRGPVRTNGNLDRIMFFRFHSYFRLSGLAAQRYTGTTFRDVTNTSTDLIWVLLTESGTELGV